MASAPVRTSESAGSKFALQASLLRCSRALLSARNSPGLVMAHEPVNLTVPIIPAASFVLLAVWLFFTNPAWVIRAGNLYAEHAERKVQQGSRETRQASVPKRSRMRRLPSVDELHGRVERSHSDGPFLHDAAEVGMGPAYGANLQYAGFATKWEQIVVRGRLDSGSFLACYVIEGRIDAAFGLNRAKEVRRVMPLIKARRAVNLDQLRDEGVDLRSLQASP